MADDDVDDVQLAHREIVRLQARIQVLEDRDAELEAGIVRMAAYLGVVHVLKDTGPK